MHKLHIIILLGLVCGCSPSGIKYSDRVSEYERQMAICPPGHERACQEQYEHIFTAPKH